MEILHLSHTNISCDFRILKEIRCLARSKYKFNVVAIGIEMQHGENLKITDDNISIYSLKLKSKKWIKLPRILRHICVLIEFYAKVISIVRNFKPKVIHCHDTAVLPIGVIIKIFSKAKLIYDAHELESQRNGLSNLESKMIFFVEKILWKYINALIVVSPSILSWYKENLGDKKAEIIMNSPYFDKINNTDSNDYFREIYKIPKTSKIFIYIGEFMQGRGIEQLLDIFQKDLSSHIVFLGYNSECGRLKNLMPKVAEKSLNIHIHDAVANDKLISIAKSADVGLCFIQNISLSDYYCLPNKLFEYAFSAIPVLASNFPDISNLVNQYNLGKCVNLDIDDMYEAVKEFENMEKLPEINVENLYDLSWEAQEAKLLKLYDDLVVSN